MIDTYEALNLEIKYNQLNLIGITNMKEEKYEENLPIYKELILLSKQLKNSLLEIESIINLGICLFYNGKIYESIDIFQSAIRLESSIDKSNIYNPILLSTFKKFKIKSLCNLLLSFVSVNKLDKAKEILENLLSFLEREGNSLVSYANLILFGYRSVSVYLSSLLEESSSDDSFLVIVKGYIEILLKTEILEENQKIESWMRTLKEQSSVFKDKKDINGFIYSILNSTLCQIVLLIRQSKDKDKTVSVLKKRLEKIIKFSFEERNFLKSEEIKNDTKLLKENPSVEEIIQSFLLKIEFGRRVFSSFQKIDSSNELQIQSQSKQQVLLLFIKSTLKYLSLETDSIQKINTSDLISQLKYTQEAIENNQFDINDIDIDAIDPDIFNSYRILYNNLSFIRYKQVLLQYFKKWMFMTLGYTSRKALIKYKTKKFKIFSSKQLNSIRDGMLLNKFNFSSKGIKTHFYQLSVDDSCIKIYEKQGKPSFSKLFFSEIKKFSFGIVTSNFKNKTLSYKNQLFPWECFSLTTNKRTLDFHSDDSTVDTWFYGLKSLFSELNMEKFIPSVSYYRLLKLKMKLFNQLLLSNHPLSQRIQHVPISSVSFIKILLLYKKIFNK